MPETKAEGFDRNCQDLQHSHTADSCMHYKAKALLYLSIKDHLCLSLPLSPPPLFSLYFLAPTPSLPWFFPPAWVSRTAQSPLMTPNQIYLHYFTSPCWNSYIWYIFNSISSGNVPLPDKSNHSNLETRKMHWDLKRQTRDIPLSVCVRVPQVKDHLLILVRRENTVCLAKRRWTLTEPWLKYTCKALSRTFQHIRTSQTLLRLVFAVV